MDKTIKKLRVFFRISNAAFICMDSIVLAFDGKPVETKMKQLHKIALYEIEKENPDLSIIDALLIEMGKTAELNK